MNSFIAAPNRSLAKIIERQIMHEFQALKRPTFILPEDRGPLIRLAGLEQANLFVACSGREFLSMHEWPKFVKRLRIEFEIRCMRGPASMYSKWIEVYLP